MKTTLIIAAMAALTAGAAQAAQVHVCTDKDGKKTFQQVPCEGAKTSETKTYEVQNVGTEMKKLDIEQGITDRNNRQLDRDIKKSEDKITEYQQAMSRELSLLRSKKRHANNNLAGAQWEESISSEMNAVTAKWDSMIRTEQGRLDNLRAQRFK